MAGGGDALEPVTAAHGEPVLAVGEIQGNVLPGFNTRHQTLLGLRFDGDARTWLASVLPSISTLADVHGYRLVRRQARLRDGQTVVYEQAGHGLDGEIEHFGFRDGISSAGARGRLDSTRDGFLTRRTIDSDRFGRRATPATTSSSARATARTVNGPPTCVTQRPAGSRPASPR